MTEKNDGESKKQFHKGSFFLNIAFISKITEELLMFISH